MFIMAGVYDRPVTERHYYGVELQSFGFVYGEQADAVDVRRRDRSLTKFVVPCCDEIVQSTGIAAHPLAYGVHEYHNILSLAGDAVKFQYVIELLAKLIKRHLA